MGILVKTVRINGFRGLQNTEVDLGLITVLTGMNNTGKTTFLKALQIALGSKNFVCQDDFFISDGGVARQIIIDVKIVPADNEGNVLLEFEDVWEIALTIERIRIDEGGSNFIPLRTIIIFDPIKNSYKCKQYILQDWPLFRDEDTHWYNASNGTEKAFLLEEIPFFYMDAQRDIIEDIKSRTSYLGRMLTRIEYSQEDIERIETQIEELNESTVSSSAILSNIKTTLKELDSAMDSSSNGVEITPFTKKIRDLNKGLSIYYSDNNDSFSMEYHGMGTRSWSSLLSLKSFISILKSKAEDEEEPFFPIVAIEEPESHLHPNAQKKLYNQMAGLCGQKIISTHSTYIAASADLSQIRSIYKTIDTVKFGKIETELFDSEELRKIKRQVLNTRGDIFFAKVLVLFEGETEEQALPIFAEKYFGKTPVEIGIDFIGVGGAGNYLPFIRVASGLKIPWYIFSDGEDNAKRDVKKAVEKLLNRHVDIEQESNIIILPNGNDFERSLIEEGYLDEIKASFSKLYGEEYLEKQIHLKNGTLKKKIKSGVNCLDCGQAILSEILRDYDGDEGVKEAIYDCMTTNKTSFGPTIAIEICESNKTLPANIQELFQKLSLAIFQNQEAE